MEVSSDTHHLTLKGCAHIKTAGAGMGINGDFWGSNGEGRCFFILRVYRDLY